MEREKQPLHSSAADPSGNQTLAGDPEEIWPDCLLITETNVPHQENISYLSAGDEAHMVYQFPLPPLTLHACLRGNARWLRQWAQSLEQETFPANTTFFNFLASHDGIGLRPVENILSTEEKAFWSVK